MTWHLVLDAGAVEQCGQLLAALDGGGADKHRAPTLVHVLDLRQHRLPLALLCGEHHVRGVLPQRRLQQVGESVIQIRMKHELPLPHRLRPAW